MSTPRLVVAAFAFTGLAACGSSDVADEAAARGPLSTPSSAASAKAPTPTTDAPKSEKHHVVHVIVRDKGRSYSPGTCIAASGDTEFPDVVVISGVDLEGEREWFGPKYDTPIPRQATRLADGTCESKVKVRVPASPQYTAGIAQSGGGIPTRDDPGELKFHSQGDSQQITLLNYRS